jgi:hypothetical protein
VNLVQSSRQSTSASVCVLCGHPIQYRVSNFEGHRRIWRMPIASLSIVADEPYALLTNSSSRLTLLEPEDDFETSIDPLLELLLPDSVMMAVAINLVELKSVR